MPAEKCEWCGRFGAKSGKYIDVSRRLPLITLYLCDRCDTKQRQWDAAGNPEPPARITLAAKGGRC